MDIDMNEIENRFIKYNTNDIILTGEQMDILDEYEIDYRNCKSMTELINLIERSMDDSNYDDLDYVSSMLAEVNYYHNTNK